MIVAANFPGALSSQIVTLVRHRMLYGWQEWCIMAAIMSRTHHLCGAAWFFGRAFFFRLRVGSDESHRF
jgi:hypothetical protein